MKKNNLYLCFLVVLSVLFSNCEKPENNTNSSYTGNILILNYGSYETTPSTISNYDSKNETISSDVYAKVNDVELNSNIQYIYQNGENVFMLGNSVDQVVITNKDSLKQSINGIKEGIEKPRFCVAKDNYLYISCWGANPDWFKMPDSYIAVLNISSGVVEKKIALPGGPEGLEIVNEKLYAALNYKDSIAYINLSDNSVSYIETPATSSYFLKTPDNNLYVSLVSYIPGKTTGLGYVNTSSNTLDATYELENISTQYCSNMQANADFSKIYVISSAYDENWDLSGKISVFNVDSSAFQSKPFIEGVKGINALSVDPDSDNVFCFISNGGSDNGTMKVFDSEATLINEVSTGINPSWSIFLK